jgi:N-acetylneuraminic acid mutarotase
MADIKLGDKHYFGVNAVKLNTVDGGMTTFYSGGGGSAELNIAYGDTAPEDTSKLWVKAEQPSNVVVSPVALPGDTEVSASGTLLPNTASKVKAVTIGKKIYLLGSEGGTTATETIRVFDTETNKVTTISLELPEKTLQGVAAAVGNKIYLFGGNSSYINTIRVFDTETNEVITLSETLKSAVLYPSVAAIGTKIYILGGRITSSMGYYYYESYVQIFDTETNTITQKGGFLSSTDAGNDRPAAAVGNKIYLFGGTTRGSNASSSTTLDSIYVKDLEAGTTSTLSVKLPEKVTGLSAATVYKKIYLFGFSTGAIYVFNTVDDTITEFTAAFSAKRTGVGAAAVGDRIYLFGGVQNSANLNAIDVLSERKSLSDKVLHLKTRSDANRFSLIRTNYNSVEVGVEEVHLGNPDGVAERVPAALYNGTDWVEI